VRYEVDASLGVAFLRTMNETKRNETNERTNEARRRYLARSGSRSRDPEIDLPRPSVERQARGASGRAAFDGTQVIASAKCSRSELSRGLVERCTGGQGWQARALPNARAHISWGEQARERASRRERAVRVPAMEAESHDGRARWRGTEGTGAEGADCE